MEVQYNIETHRSHDYKDLHQIAPSMSDKLLSGSKPSSSCSSPLSSSSSSSQSTPPTDTSPPEEVQTIKAAKSSPLNSQSAPPVDTSPFEGSQTILAAKSSSSRKHQNFINNINQNETKTAPTHIINTHFNPSNISPHATVAQSSRTSVYEESVMSLEKLPLEVLHTIFDYLELPELCRVKQVSRGLSDACAFAHLNSLHMTLNISRKSKILDGPSGGKTAPSHCVERASFYTDNGKFQYIPETSNFLLHVFLGTFGYDDLLRNVTSLSIECENRFDYKDVRWFFQHLVKNGLGGNLSSIGFDLIDISDGVTASWMLAYVFEHFASQCAIQLHLRLFKIHEELLEFHRPFIISNAVTDLQITFMNLEEYDLEELGYHDKNYNQQTDGDAPDDLRFYVDNSIDAATIRSYDFALDFLQIEPESKLHNLSISCKPEYSIYDGEVSFVKLSKFLSHSKDLRRFYAGVHVLGGSVQVLVGSNTTLCKCRKEVWSGHQDPVSCEIHRWINNKQRPVTVIA